jgi:uncharacterized protein
MGFKMAERYFVWINSLLGVLASLLYFLATPATSLLEAGFYVISLFTQITLITYLVYLPFSFLPEVIRKRLLPLLFSVLILFIIVDSQIYSFFYFHINAMVWNVLSTEGGWSTLGIGNLEIGIYSIAAFVFIFSEYKFLAFLQKKNLQIFPLKKYVLGVFVVHILGVFTYAYGDLYDIQPITRVYQIVPYYQPLTIKRTYHRIYGKLPTPQINLNAKRSGNLNYPLHEMIWEEPAKKLNYIFIVVDCFRLMSFNQEITPELWKFSQRSQTFLNHFSGGNSTRNGVFSILYGIYSSYWDHFLQRNQTPVFIDRLQDLGYQTQVYASTLQSFPEFRKTAFVKMNEFVKDDYPGLAYEKDKQVLDAVSEYAIKNKSQKFFTYSLLDGAHSAYSFPNDEVVFKPIITSVIYSALTEEEKRVHLKNRYMNGLRYVDKQLGQFLKKLEDNGVLENTVVMITGDHGDEFMEFGNVGHSNAFTLPQIKSPLILYIPGMTGKTYQHSTIHNDIMPTLLPTLGAKNPASDYSHGVSLFDTEAKKDIFVCSWDNCAIVDDNGFMIFGTKSYNSQKVEFRNSEYQIIPKSEGMQGDRMKAATQVLKRMSELLR